MQSRNYGVKYTFNKFNLKQVNTLSYKTVSANKKTVNKEWVVVDANNEILGRLCTKIAMMIRGKHKPGFTPHVDCGDNVIVINADKVKLTGNKFSEKQYVSYTGYPGGQRFATPTTFRCSIVVPKRTSEHAPTTRWANCGLLCGRLIKSIHPRL